MPAHRPCNGSTEIDVAGRPGNPTHVSVPWILAAWNKCQNCRYPFILLVLLYALGKSLGG